MNSTIFIGTITHVRHGDIENKFIYPLNMYAFDIDELNQLDSTISVFSYNKRNIISIWDQDYLTQEPKPIKEKLLAILDKEGCGDRIHQIILLTAPRYINYVFNPMSAYYCFTPEGSLRCCLVEVNNTFGDKHIYVVDNPISKPTDEVIGHFKINKGFHVSPFYDIVGEYEFKFSDIREKLDVQFDMRSEKDLFNARLVGIQKEPLTKSNLIKNIFRYPINAWLTMPRILWQAAKLYLIKKVPFHPRPEPLDRHTIRSAPESLSYLEKAGRWGFLNFLKKLKNGSLTITFPGGRIQEFGDGQDPKLELRILKNSFFSKIALGGEIGLGESYVDQDWETNDLTGLLVFLSQMKAQTPMLLSWPKQIVEKINRFFQKNSIAQAEKNIHDHYDIMNDLFFLFLDDRKIYSSGIYEHADDTLEQAQLNKLNAIIKSAKITSGDNVLEIGFGWGGFAVEAVKQTGCRFTGITLSENQLEYAQDLIKKEQLTDKITLKKEDYRNTIGQYDKIISIEMLEAVGDEYLTAYFQKCNDLLKPGGLFVFQTITYPDEKYARYKNDVDWIKKHIFPGGHLPSLRAIVEIIEHKTDFEIIGINPIGLSYVKTLSEWCKKFSINADKIKALGFDDAFIRKWVYYFCFCEAGFKTQFINDYQITLRKKMVRI